MRRNAEKLTSSNEATSLVLTVDRMLTMAEGVLYPCIQRSVSSLIGIVEGGEELTSAGSDLMIGVRRRSVLTCREGERGEREREGRSRSM
jgi:hypothetical protein